MSCIPTAILWKIFYSYCLYVFIDCKNVSLALSCATGALGWSQSQSVWVCCGAWSALGDPEGENSAAHTHTHVHIQRISKHLALNSLVFKKTCKCSCKKGETTPGNGSQMPAESKSLWKVDC